MKKSKEVPLTGLFEKGYAEYFGLCLVFTGGAWMIISVLDSFRVMPVSGDLCNYVAVCIICTLLCVYGFIGARGVYVALTVNSQCGDSPDGCMPRTN
ncbi:hypothetical protein NEPAR06_0946 [Nematocida parisii]|nr:hypothetical protein NEPAR03_1869 [Nematocida parisii]KAI5130129.1 hypothetical protein NEPAR08_1867 [Nematocida parisii]KAI5143918.1 hypothetical protein NEPAR04_1999 [Nematocida parisii]KAI5154213.1 hypothetical protein NEPAR06_0946 [Nematocida parisii]